MSSVTYVKHTVASAEKEPLFVGKVIIDETNQVVTRASISSPGGESRLFLDFYNRQEVEEMATILAKMHTLLTGQPVKFSFTSI